jgi:carbamoylphosphate synthase large subunit
MSFRILLTCAGGGLAPQVIQYLRHQSRHGSVFVVAVDSSGKAAGRHFSDAFELVPDGSEPDYASRLAEIADRYAVDLVLPGSDEEALAAARSRELIERNGRKLACTDIATLETLADKTAAYEALERGGLPVPHWRRVNTIAELEIAVEQFLALGLEIAVKPAVSRGGRDVSVIRSDISGASPYGGGREVHMDVKSFKREYLMRYAEHMPVMVMERLYEPTFDLDMLARDGVLLRSVARRRLNPAVPNDGHIIEQRPDLYELAPQIASIFNLTWLYDCDIMLDGEGRPRILEINPRPSGSTAVAVAAGIPLLDDLISLALGETLPEVALPCGRVIVPYFALAPAAESV